MYIDQAIINKTYIPLAIINKTYYTTWMFISIWIFLYSASWLHILEGVGVEWGFTAIALTLFQYLEAQYQTVTGPMHKTRTPCSANQ